jgi:hypothetical protein
MAELSLTVSCKSQIKAAVRVNSEMLRFYWSLGKDIEERKLEKPSTSIISILPYFQIVSNLLTIPKCCFKNLYQPHGLKFF